MIRTVQTRVGENGNCFMACLSSLLEVPLNNIPDFKASNLDAGVNPWLQGRGLKYSEVPASDPAPVGLHIAIGTSPRGGQHAAVYKDGKLVHDPHPPDGTGRGLVDVSHWGVLTPTAKDAVSLSPDRDGEMQLSYTALDAAIRGKELSAAAQALLTKHDDICHQWVRIGGSRQSAYAAMQQPVTSLLREAETLLRSTRISDKSTWVAKLAAAKDLLSEAKGLATAGQYGRATSYMDAAISAVHYVIDALRALARRTGAKDAALPAPVPPYKPGDSITLKNGKRTTVTKVLPAKNLFGEKEFHVSTKTGEVLPVKVRGKDVYGWSEGTPSAVIKKAQEVAKKQSAAALQRDREREAREYLKRGGGSRVAEAEAKRVLTKDADATTAWQVWSRGGSIGNKGPSLISEHPTREEAAAKAKRMNKLLSPGEKSYYGLGYGIKESGRVKDRTRMHRALDRALDVVQMKGSK